MEGLNLNASLIEMQKLIGGKIDKVQQPQKDVIVLHVHTSGGNFRLLLSAIPDSARVQITERKYENPQEAPNFCMLLRKRISGGKITGLAQPNLDRILLISLEARNELGDIDNYTLAVELMGRYSNIIFIDSSNKITDCTRRVGADMSSVRQLVPGVLYNMPPTQDKKDPRRAEKEDFIKALESNTRINSALVDSFFGLSPDMAKRLVSNVTDKRDAMELTQKERENIASYLFDFYTNLKNGKADPHVLLDENSNAIKIYPFKIADTNSKSVESMQAGLDLIYASKDVRQQMDRMSLSYRRIIKNNIERCERKMAMFAQTLNTGDDIEKLRLCGELLTANLHLARSGMKSIEVMNYYMDPPQIIRIPLDEACSLSANAQRYYKQYRKAKIAYDMAEERMNETKVELEYLEGVLLYLDNVTNTAEMLEIRDELALYGYLKEQKNQKKAKPRSASEPMKYLSSDGTLIYVGKNNKQNDNLTFGIANSEDFWLHVKNAPGSHVIIKSANPEKQTLYEAALLAAYYSSLRGGANVPVDYTQRKHVKKPSGAKAGMVIYLKNSTAYVTPSEQFINSLNRA